MIIVGVTEGIVYVSFKIQRLPVKIQRFLWKELVRDNKIINK